jgi:hypothetical protein
VLAAVAVGTGIAGPRAGTDLSKSRQAAFPVVAAPSTPRPAVHAALPAGDPGRVLTAAAARLVVRAVGATPSPGWTTATFPNPAGPMIVRPAACEPLQTLKFLDIRPGPLSRAQHLYRGPADLLPLGSEFLSVEVRSYARPVPASVLASARLDLRPCHRYTASSPASPGTSYYSQHAGPVPDVGAPAWRVDASFAHRIARSAWIFIVITAGHNLILITQLAAVDYVVPPPDEAAMRTAVTAVMDALRQR